MTDHEARGWTAKPYHGCGDLFRFAEASDGFLRHHPPHDFWIVILRDESGHRRVDHSRTDRVDADALGGIVESGAPRQTNHCVLARRICAATSGTLQAADRGTIDDRATSLRQHLAKFALHAVPHAAQIDVHHALEFVVAGFQKRGSLGIHAGIVEGCVEPPIGADGALDHRIDLSGIGHVTGDTDGVVTRCAQALGRLADHLLVTISNDHGCASFGECLRCRQANATASSCDQCHFSIESWVYHDRYLTCRRCNLYAAEYR